MCACEPVAQGGGEWGGGAGDSEAGSFISSFVALCFMKLLHPIRD